MTVIFHTNAGSPVLAGDMLISTAGSKTIYRFEIAFSS